MAFSQETIEAAWERSGGKCECGRSTHGHVGRCSKTLSKETQGRAEGLGSWEAHHTHSVQSGGLDALSNCEILCSDCHTKTM